MPPGLPKIVCVDELNESIAATIFAAAWADGVVTDQEKMALDRVLVELGFDRGEIMNRIARALEAPKWDPIPMPEDTALKERVMRYALAVCLADGALNEDEVNFLHRLAEYLKMSAQSLNQLKVTAEKVMADREADSGRFFFEKATLAKIDQRVELAPEDEEDSDRRTVYEGESFGGEIEF